MISELEPILTEEDREEEDFEVSDNEDSISEDDDCGLSKDDVPVEQFTTPDFDDFDGESDHELPNTYIDTNSWILVWILKYQSRFCLSDVAIDSLIKFLRMVLLDANRSQFENFPTSY